METIQALDAPLKVSDDGGGTWLDIVCLLNYDIPLSRDVNQLATFCGIATGYGPVKFSAKGSGAVEAEPDDATQASLNRILNWFLANTKLLFKSEYPGSGGSAGENFYISGSARFSDLDVKAPDANNVIQFDFTLTGEGTLDINA